MLSITESKKILNRNGLSYTDEEINAIREFVYVLAEIDYEIFIQEMREREEAKIIPISNNQNTINDEKDSDTLHPGEHRRAS